MKKHYFFVTADFKFRKKYVNTQYDSHPTDVWRFDQKETYMIEQKKDETDEIFFPALKKYITDALDAYADSWLAQSNSKVPQDSGWQWAKDSVSLITFSKLN
ncbi:hypothetical protein IPF86_03005 [Candidatus Nomurabacteria bacterium]|nr:MAG: hypothetical protein IPF86_03005 [Candidatus Nomurabacteria bacterium]